MCGEGLGIDEKYLIVGNYQDAKKILEELPIEEGCQLFYSVANEKRHEGLVKIKGLESFARNTIHTLTNKLNDTQVYRLIGGQNANKR